MGWQASRVAFAILPPVWPELRPGGSHGLGPASDAQVAEEHEGHEGETGQQNPSENGRFSLSRHRGNLVDRPDGLDRIRRPEDGPTDVLSRLRHVGDQGPRCVDDNGAASDHGLHEVTSHNLNIDDDRLADESRSLDDLDCDVLDLLNDRTLDVNSRASLRGLERDLRDRLPLDSS